MIKILKAVNVGGEVHVKGDFVKLPKEVEAKYIKAGYAAGADDGEAKKTTKKKARSKK